MFEELPTRFGPFVVTQRLGSGSCGEVLRATDGRHRRVVALKIPKFSKDDVLARRRFEREARVGQDLHHPNLCPIHEAGEINGVPYLAMRFVEGDNLEKRVPEGYVLPVAQAIELVWILSHAVAAMHRVGVIHRDLKPSNVVFDNTGVPVIVDFGLARSINQDYNLTRPGAMLGTPYYMPPEMALGDEPDPRSDVYSLGVMLFRLIAGRPPFAPPNLLNKILSEPPPSLLEFWPDLNPLLDAIVMKALAKKVEGRFATMDQFSAVLEHYLEGRYEDAQQLVDTRSDRGPDTPRSLRVPADSIVPTPIPSPTPSAELSLPQVAAATPTPGATRGKDSTVEPSNTVLTHNPAPARPHLGTREEIALPSRTPTRAEIALAEEAALPTPARYDPTNLDSLSPSILRRQAEQAQAEARARFLAEASPEELRTEVCQDPFDRAARRAYLERRTPHLTAFDEADVPPDAVSRQVWRGALWGAGLGFAVGALAVGSILTFMSESNPHDWPTAGVLVIGCGIIAASFTSLVCAFYLAVTARRDWASLGPLPPGAYLVPLSEAQEYYLPEDG